jgi:hypothetical protein
MVCFRSNFRAVICGLLVSVLSGVFPASGADALPRALTLPDIASGIALEFAVAQPGTLAIPDPTPQQAVQQPAEQTPATASPAKPHHSRRVWVAVIAGLAIGAGAAIVVTNRQSGRTSQPVTGATVNVGGASPGAP